MKLKEKVAIGVISVVAVVGSTVAYAANKYAGPETKATYMMEKISKKLELDQAQQDKLTIAKDAALKLRESMGKERGAVKQDVLSAVSGDTLDRDQLLDLINTKTNAVQEQAPEVIAALGDFYDSLNAEQQAEVREKMEKMMERGKGHKKGHKHGGGDRD